MIANWIAIEGTLFTHQSPSSFQEIVVRIVGQTRTNGAYVQYEEMLHIVDS